MNRTTCRSSASTSESLIATLKGEQENADDDVDCIYDTTAEAGLAMTGFRHDRNPAVPGDPEPVQVLRRIGQNVGVP